MAQQKTTPTASASPATKPGKGRRPVLQVSLAHDMAAQVKQLACAQNRSESSMAALLIQQGLSTYDQHSVRSA